MKQVLHKSKENYEDNKIIRKFMEGTNGVILYSNYHLDWNALMTVVEKIERSCNATVKISSGELAIYIFNQKEYDAGNYDHYDYYNTDWAGNKLEKLHEMIVEFIKWYTKNKQK